MPTVIFKENGRWAGHPWEPQVDVRAGIPVEVSDELCRVAQEYDALQCVVTEEIEEGGPVESAESADSAEAVDDEEVDLLGEDEPKKKRKYRKLNN